MAIGGDDRTFGCGNRRPAAASHTRGPQQPGMGVALSADGRLAGSPSVDGSVCLWDAERRHLLTILQGNTGPGHGAALSNDGRLVACGCQDGTVGLWERASGQLLDSLHGHAGVVSSVALSRDRRLLASGGDDGILRLWNTRSGTCRRTLRADRRYRRMDMTGLTGVTDAQRSARLELGAIEAPVCPGWFRQRGRRRPPRCGSSGARQFPGYAP